MAMLVESSTFCVCDIADSCVASYNYPLFTMQDGSSSLWLLFSVGECLYNTEQQLYKRLAGFCDRPWVLHHQMKTTVVGSN